MEMFALATQSEPHFQWNMGLFHIAFFFVKFNRSGVLLDALMSIKVACLRYNKNYFIFLLKD